MKIKTIKKEAGNIKTKKSAMNEITKEMSIIEILDRRPNSHEIMAKYGMHCIGCGGAAFESLENGSLMHGISQNNINKMVKEINELTNKRNMKV